jgi:hypothetical protein
MLGCKRIASRFQYASMHTDNNHNVTQVQIQ